MSEANGNKSKPESANESIPDKKTKMEDTKYLPELLAEKDSLDSSFTHAMKLISAGRYERASSPRLTQAKLR